MQKHIETFVKSLEDYTEQIPGRLFALRVLLDSTELADRRTLATECLSEQLDHGSRTTLKAAGNFASRVRNRLVHPRASAATDLERFDNFQEADAQSHEALDEGFNMPLWRSWADTLRVADSVEVLRTEVAQLIQATDILAHSGPIS